MSYPQQPGNWPDPSWPSGGQVSGAPASPQGAYGYGAPPMVVASPPTNGLAIASLVCSLAGLFTCGVTALIGAILGHVARRQIRERGENGDGMAVAGVISGWIIFALALIGGIAYVGFIVWAVNEAANSPSYSDY